MAQDAAGKRIELGDKVYSITKKTDGLLVGIKEYLDCWHRYHCTITVKFDDGNYGYFHADRLVKL